MTSHRNRSALNGIVFFAGVAGSILALQAYLGHGRFATGAGIIIGGITATFLLIWVIGPEKTTEPPDRKGNKEGPLRAFNEGEEGKDFHRF